MQEADRTTADTHAQAQAFIERWQGVTALSP